MLGAFADVDESVLFAEVGAAVSTLSTRALAAEGISQRDLSALRPLHLALLVYLWVPLHVRALGFGPMGRIGNALPDLVLAD